MQADAMALPDLEARELEARGVLGADRGDAVGGRRGRVAVVLGVLLGLALGTHLGFVHLYRGGVTRMREHLALVAQLPAHRRLPFPWDDHILALTRATHRVPALVALGLLGLAVLLSRLGERRPRARRWAWGCGLAAAGLALVSQLAQVEHWTLSASLRPWAFLVPARVLLVVLGAAALWLAWPGTGASERAMRTEGADRGAGPGGRPRRRSVWIAVFVSAAALAILVLAPTLPTSTRPREAIAVCRHGLPPDDLVWNGFDACFEWGELRPTPAAALLLSNTARNRAYALAVGSERFWSATSGPGREATPDFTEHLRRMIAHYAAMARFSLRWNAIRAPALVVLPFGVLGLLLVTGLLRWRGRRGAAAATWPRWAAFSWGIVGVVALVLATGMSPVLSNWPWWYYAPGAPVLALAVGFGVVLLRSGRPACGANP